MFIISVFSKEFTAYEEAYYEYEMDEGDKLFVDLKKQNNMAVLFWNQENDGTSSLSLCNKTMCNLTQHLENNFASIKAYNFSVKLQNKALVKLWVIPKSVCPEAIFLYSTSHFLSDDFTYSSPKFKETEGSPIDICLFFTNSKPKMNFNMEIVMKKQAGVAPLQVFDQSSISTPISNCNEKSCAFKPDKFFFAQVKRLLPGSSIRLDYTLDNYESGNMPCERFIVPSYENDYSVLQSVFFGSNTLTCFEDENVSDDLYQFGVIFALFIIICIFIFASVYCGLCNPCIRFLRRLVHADIPNVRNAPGIAFDVDQELEPLEKEELPETNQ